MTKVLTDLLIDIIAKKIIDLWDVRQPEII